MKITELCEKIKELYKDNQSINIYVENNSIILEQEFVDATLVSLQGFAKEKKTFKHIITFEGTQFITLDQIKGNVIQGHGDSLTLTTTLGNNVGQFHISGCIIGLGKDNITGEVGPVIQKWNSNDLKNPVKNYLESLGLIHKKSLGIDNKLNKIILCSILGGMTFICGLIGIILFIFLR